MASAVVLGARYRWARGRLRYSIPDWPILGRSRSFEGGGSKRYSRKSPAFRNPHQQMEDALFASREPSGWESYRAIGRRWLPVARARPARNMRHDGLQSGTRWSRGFAGRGSPLRGCGYGSAAVSAETRSWVLGVFGLARGGLGEYGVTRARSASSSEPRIVLEIVRIVIS